LTLAVRETSHSSLSRQEARARLPCLAACRPAEFVRSGSYLFFSGIWHCCASGTTVKMPGTGLCSFGLMRRRSPALGTSRAIAYSMNMQYLSPEQVLDVLVKCPQCGAWPMSRAPQDDRASFGLLSFKCPKCRRLEVFRGGVAGRLIPPTAGDR
jgi:phage FluMu protein Com